MAQGDLNVSITSKGIDFDGKKYTGFRSASGKEDYDDLVREFRADHAKIAKDVVREEVRRDQFDPEYRREVDRVLDNPEELVKFLGRIRYFAREEIGPILLDIYHRIKTLSPVSKGDYKNRHYVFFDGVVVAKTTAQLKTWVTNKLPEIDFAGKKVRFVNVSAYARKLETDGNTAKGINAKRPKLGKRDRPRIRNGVRITTKMPPNGVYWIVGRAVKRLYSSISTGYIKPEMLLGSNLGVSGLSKQAGARRTTYAKPERGGPYLYPTIVIQLSGRGTKNKGVLQ